MGNGWMMLSGVIKKPPKWLSQIVLITALVALITLLHYATSMGKPVEHEFYHKFYYLPIILSGLFFGLRGGLLASLSISLLYLPHLILQWQASFASQVDRFLEAGLFIVVGILVGVIVDSERKQHQKAQQKAFSDEKWMIIEVADIGPGIPEELLDSVFTPFVSAKKNGTGLGLAIAERIISDHGGQIWAQNLKQGGALVGFKIPLK